VSIAYLQTTPRDVRALFRVLEGLRQMTDVQTRTDTEQEHEEPAHACAGPSRRNVLAGAGALGATCLLAACGTSPGSSTTNPNGSDYQATPAPAGSGPANAGGGTTDGGATKGAAKGGTATALVAVADVPEGGGVIKGAYVITQPAKGTFKAFSKVCTHQGCDVNKIDGGVISCPCHGSQFSLKDGSVKGGPAPKGLPETAVKVDGDNVVKA
jgi:Rieske Fe-S protein